jgi:hypothetical protein
MSKLHQIGESKSMNKANSEGGGIVTWTLAILMLVWLGKAGGWL